MIRKFAYAVFFLLLTALTAANPTFAKDSNSKAQAEPITALAEASNANITVGEPLELKITVKYKKDIELIGGISEPEITGFEIKGSKDWEDRAGSYYIVGRTFTLSGYQLGNYLIEPIEISYRSHGGAVQSIKTNPIYIAVKSVAEGEEKTDIRDVKGVVKLPYKLAKYLLPIGIILLITILLLVYLLYFRKRANQNLSPAEKLSPADQALRDLHELFDSALIREGRVKAYYLRFSEILRIFIEKQFGIQAAEATTSEITRMMKRIQLAEESKKNLTTVLEAADFAKFARWVPTPEDILSLNKQAETVVRDLSSQLSQAGGASNAVP